jgi:hypothetical protein
MDGKNLEQRLIDKVEQQARLIALSEYFLISRGLLGEFGEFISEVLAGSRK